MQSFNLRASLKAGQTSLGLTWLRTPRTHMGLAKRKPVIGASDKVRFKPVASATEIS